MLQKYAQKRKKKYARTMLKKNLCSKLCFISKKSIIFAQKHNYTPNGNTVYKTQEWSKKNSVSANYR